MTVKQEIEALMKKDSYDLADLIAVTRILRSEEGCPWDREQDHKSIRSSMIEETYEVVEAIDTENPVLLREELGDVLFQVMFHSQLESEKGTFGVHEVIDDVCKKMIHRHPHVFGDVCAETSDAVLQNWEQIKTEEKQRNTLTDRLRAIPPMLPALMRSSKVGKKAERSRDVTPDELLKSLAQAATSLSKEPPADADAKKAAIGAMLAQTVDLARAWGVDAELALTENTDRFIDKIEAASQF